jgi:hypothetical protein
VMSRVAVGASTRPLSRLRLVPHRQKVERVTHIRSPPSILERSFPLPSRA